MKKQFMIIAMVILCCSPFAAALSTPTAPTDHPQNNTTASAVNFTHTVFIEECTATTCPYCPNAANALYNMYNSSNYSFYYIALVYNKNIVSKNRIWGHYRDKVVPTIFIDGGFNQTVGVGSNVQQTEEQYRHVIENSSERSVYPLEVTTSVTGHNNAKLDITVTVKNTGAKPYIGIVRSYVTEIISRWINANHDPYHFGFLDYAIKKLAIILPQKTKTYTVTFDGAAKHGNSTFADIVDNNIMVISTVASLKPHMIAGDENIGQHLAFFVDQTSAAKVL